MATEGFKGMAELIRGLERLGGAVQTEAASIVRTTAQLMAARVRSLYPRRPAGRKAGALQDRVVIEEGRGQFTATHRSGGGVAGTFVGSLRWKVRSKAPHAHLYEFGTVVRRTASRGANRGRMGATPTFVPEAVRARERMRRELIALIERQSVPGMTGRLEVRQG